MKNLYIILCSAILLSFASCKKDNGNYDYQSKEKISITGLEPNYTVISAKDNLVIDPTVTTTDPNAKLEYLWGIYETNVQGSAPVLDTIARSKKLSYLVNQPAKGWVLVLRITNKNTNYSQYFTSGINVVTEFTRGWYVAKDDGLQTDLDLFLTPTNIIPESKRENIYSLINGTKLNGTAKIMNFFSSYKSTVTGTLGNTKALVLTTDKDISAMNINTLKSIRTLNTLFYEAPVLKAPDYAFPASSAYYVINDGQCYAIYNFGANDGRFSARKMKDASNTPYHLSKYFMASTSIDPYFFDETSSSFISMSMGSGTTMSDIVDIAGTAMSTKNNNKKLLYMGFKSTTYIPAPTYAYSSTGFAILQDKTDPSIKILSEIYGFKMTMKLTNDTLKTSDKLYNATAHTLLFEDENVMYFAVGNQVWSRNLSSKSEILQYTIPAGEELTFIRHKKYAVAADLPFNYNYVMIGTKLGENYKVRMFTKSSGSLATTPAFVLEGKGNARDVMYVSPSVSESTYQPTF